MPVHKILTLHDRNLLVASSSHFSPPAAMSGVRPALRAASAAAPAVRWASAVRRNMDHFFANPSEIVAASQRRQKPNVSCGIAALLLGPLAVLHAAAGCWWLIF